MTPSDRVNPSFPKLVLLPGLDGTGDMFHPFIDALPPDIETHIIRYSPTDLMAYYDLIEYVAEDIAQLGDVVLLGESFSGPIALELAASGLDNVKGVIFCATFAESPRPLLLRLANLLPLSWLLKVPLPSVLLRLFCLGLSASNQAIQSLQNALAYVPPETIAFRLRLIHKLQSQEREIKLPSCYIQATQDRMVSVRSLYSLQRLIPRLEVFRVEGPHLILQANPQDCAKAIMQYLRSQFPLETTLSSDTRKTH